MRIDRIRVGSFGRLEDLDTGPAPLEGLVVVLGPNEAGKSTLFTFLTTALYGFHPATRERNPHMPWGADEATGQVRVRLDSGGCAEVERTLRSQPSGRLTLDGRTTELRNQAVPWVDHVPRTVFRQVFAITLAELAGLDGETWARIQDKMIGAMGAADLASARVVAEALEREAGEIWRPNRRGNQCLRDLQASLRTLRGRRAEAQERDRRIRRLVEEGEDVRAEIQAERERRQLDRAEVERARSLLPVKRQLERIAGLRFEAGAPEVLRGLPSDPPAALSELQAERSALRRDSDRIEAEVVRRETLIRQADATSSILALREEVIDLVATTHGSAPTRAKIVELGTEIDDVEARLDAAARSVLTGSWREVPADQLRSVSTELLRERLSRERESGATSPAHGESVVWVSWVLLATGAGALAWGLGTGWTIPTALGGAAIAAGLTWWLATARKGAALEAEEPPTRETAAELLDGLPIRPDLLAHPDEALISGLERLRDLVRRLDELTHAREAGRRRIEAVDAEARRLSSSLGCDGTGDADTIARDLDRRVRDAERLADAATHARREKEGLLVDLDAARARVDEVDAELGRLTERAAAIAPGDPEAGLEEARVRLASLTRAEQLEDELTRSHPNLEELTAQITALDQVGHEWFVDEQALARARARLEAHDERIEELLARAESLDGEIERLRDLETVDSVDSEVASLREEEARLTRTRDQKWVLARLLREADRRFREEHQPDLVRRAGSYLEHLTGGRYDRLVVDETHGDHLFRLVGPDLPAPVPLAPPVSTGTLEQAYLSLRLAIVDHLDQGGERLPLFVDEILVNWDGDRRRRGLDVLAGITEARQVFVFTCHPAMAAELEERGARILALSDR